MIFFIHPLVRFCKLAAGLAFLSVVLQACGSLPRQVSDVDPQLVWEQRQQQLAGIEQWQLKGRIGISTEDSSGSAKLFWKQHADRYVLRIVAPLGQGTLLIEGSAAGVTMRNSKGEEFSASNVESLIWQQTGWIIPVSDLRYWILGLPADSGAGDTYQLDSNGHMTALNGRDWQINFQRYRRVGEYELPDKIRLQNSQLRIKLAITDWNIL